MALLSRHTSQQKQGALLAAVCLLFALISLTTGADWFVSPAAGDDTNSGLSSGTPKKTLSATLSAASDNDVIRLMDGTFSASQGNCNLLVDKKVSFVGHSGNAAAAIIDCEAMGRAFTISGASIDQNVRFDAFTVQNARGVNGTGGAFHITQSSPTFSNLIVKDCAGAQGSTSQQGSAFYIASTQAQLQISNSKILNNNATKGALFVIRSNVTLSNVELSGNSAVNGGAMYAYRSSVHLSSSTVTANTATQRGGAFYFFLSIIEARDSSVFSFNSATLDGGATYSYDSTVQDNTLSNVQYLNNTAGGEGGGAYFFAGAIQVDNVKFVGNRGGASGGGLYVYTHNSQTPRLSNVEAIENVAGASGGGVFFTFSFPSCQAASILNSRFVSNRAAVSGGGLSVEGASLCAASVISSLTFEKNQASVDGGGLHVFNLPVHVNTLVSRQNHAGSSGGGAYILVNDATSEETTVENSEFDSNTSPSGAGLYSRINPVNAVLTMRACNAHNNAASSTGGGIMISSRASVNMENCQANDNSATSSGAGAHLSAVTLSLKQITARKNTLEAATDSAQLAARGAGLFVSVSTSAQFEDSTFSENVAARGTGAGVFLDILSSTTSFMFGTCVFSKNNARQGAGVYTLKSSSFSNTPTISFVDCEFSGNIMTSMVDTEVVSGGGVFVSNMQSVHLEKVKFLSNSAQTTGTGQGSGAALVNINLVTLKQDTFSLNTIVGSNFNRRGAGLYVEQCTVVNMRDSVCEKNRMSPDSSLRGTSQGGAIFASSSTVNVLNSTFTENEGVTGTASTTTSLGGAIFLTSGAVLNMQDSQLRSNKATGAAQSSGGAIYAETSSKVLLYNTTCMSNYAMYQGGCATLRDTSIDSEGVSLQVEDNSADIGGGIVLIQTTFSLSDASIKNNQAYTSGGAAWLSSSVLRASQSSFTLNNATYRGGVHSLPPNTFTIVEDVTVENNSPSFYEPYGVWVSQFPLSASIPPGIVFETTPVIEVKDYYNQTILAGSHNVQITSSSQNVILSDSSTSSVSGLATFPSITLLGEVGSKFYLYISGPSISQSAVSRNFSVGECPLGYQFSTDRCLLCEEGYFSVNGSVCTSCPVGANCYTGKLLPKDNYWKTSELSNTIYQCLPGMCENGGVCKTNHAGNLCRGCADGFSLYNNRCVQCPQNGHQFWLLFPLIIWVVFSGLVLRFLKELAPVITLTFLVFQQCLVFMLSTMRHDISIVAALFNLDASICLGDVYTRMIIINAIPVGWWLVFLSVELLNNAKKILRLKKISVREFVKKNIEGLVWLNMMVFIPTSIFNIAYFLPKSINGINYMVLDFNTEAYTPEWAYWVAVPGLGLILHSLLAPLFTVLCVVISSRQKAIMLRAAKKALAENVKCKISEMIKRNKTDEEIKEFEAKVNNEAHFTLYDQNLTSVFDLTFILRHMNIKTGGAMVFVEMLEKICWIASIAATYSQPGFDFYRMAFLCIAIVIFWSLKLFTEAYRGRLQTIVLISQALLGLIAVVYLSSVSETAPSFKLPYDIVIFILWVAILVLYTAFALITTLPRLTKAGKSKIYAQSSTAEESDEEEQELLETGEFENADK